MFPKRYFPERHFAPRYFPPAGSVVVTPPSGGFPPFPKIQVPEVRGIDRRLDDEEFWIIFD